MRRMKYILCLLLTLMIVFGRAQDTEYIQQLKKKLEKQKTGDTARVNTLNNLAWEYSFIDPAESQKHSSQALSLSLKIGFEEGEAEAYGQMGNNYRFMNNYDSAIFFHSKGFALRKKQNNPQKIIGSIINLGNVYNQKKDLPLAIVKYNEAIAMAERENYSKGALVAYTNL
ncbi:MAG: hypothetical protein K0S12_2410, partial [Bacteroidetes bacterium]|nr:hypothetical protein [Bacteroidota bacterium]